MGIIGLLHGDHRTVTWDHRTVTWDHRTVAWRS